MKLRFIFLLTIFNLTLLGNSFASPKVINGSQDRVMSIFKQSLSKYKQFALKFTQIDSSGVQSSGILIIEKPHKFRCNYFDNGNYIIIGGKNYVSIYDDEMGNLSRVNATENVFYFLLHENIIIDKNIQLLDFSESSNSISANFTHKDYDKQVKLTINKDNLAFKEMLIIEHHNLIRIKFNELILFNKNYPELYQIKDPDIFGKPKILDENYFDQLFAQDKHIKL